MQIINHNRKPLDSTVSRIVMLVMYELTKRADYHHWLNEISKGGGVDVVQFEQKLRAVLELSLSRWDAEIRVIMEM